MPVVVSAALDRVVDILVSAVYRSDVTIFTGITPYNIHHPIAWCVLEKLVLATCEPLALLVYFIILLVSRYHGWKKWSFLFSWHS